jgi:hypothetical protein
MSNLTKLEMTAIVIGAVGGLISIPKTAIEVWDAYFSEPQLEIFRSAPVVLTYEPQQKVILFTVGVSLHNKGKKSERIQNINAFFGVADDLERRAGFNETNIVLKSGPNQIPRYLSLKPDSLESITCEITAHFSEISGLFQQHETRRVLELVIAGDEGRTYSVKFSFDIGKDVASTLFDTNIKSARTIQFIGSDLI